MDENKTTPFLVSIYSSRGFFSVFVALIGIIFIISFLFAQINRDSVDAETQSYFMAQQLVSRDWALARNAFDSFASDAMLEGIGNSPSPPTSTNCSPSIMNGFDFTNHVNSYWNLASAYLSTHAGVTCYAVLNEDIEEQLTGSADGGFFSNTAGYALLTCTRTVGKTTVELTHPFALRKQVIFSVVSTPAPACAVSVETGLSTYSLDVTETFS